MFRLILIALAGIALASPAVAATGCGDDDSSNSQDAAPAADTTEDAMAADEEMAADDAMAAKGGAKVKVVSSRFGRVIADKRGEALYLFDKESTERSRCYGACAVAWPPVLTKGKPRAGKGADPKLLGTTQRRNGKLQVTYNGHPLYYYKDDEPGRILCHNVDEFGGLWLVVNPRGQAVS
jgi:predicted lipoprotein with Yx(FWY)xxD motif